MEAFDRPRVASGEPGFSIREQEFHFSPTGSPDVYSRIWSADTDTETLEKIDEFVLGVLTDTVEKSTWEALRAGEYGPPPWFDELFAIVRHIAAVTAGRPTMPSNGSSPTPQTSGTDSTASSSSVAAVA